MKQTLRDIKRTTNVTTKAIAEKAHLSLGEVFTVEAGGVTSQTKAQRVIRAFNQLSGMQVTVDQIRFVVARNLII